MTRIRFTRSPAFATVAEGLTLAAAYWRASVERWVLAVVAVAVVNGLVGWLFGSTVIDQQTMARVLVPGASGPAIDPAELPRLLAGPLAVGIVSIVAKWFLVANAIAGLRGRDVTLPWVLRSGLRALVADMLDAARRDGWRLVFVLGDPGYYGRFGFSAAAAAPFESPYAGPYLMALALGEGPLPGFGRFDYAPAFGALG